MCLRLKLKFDIPARRDRIERIEFGGGQNLGVSFQPRHLKEDQTMKHCSIPLKLTLITDTHTQLPWQVTVLLFVEGSAFSLRPKGGENHPA